MFLKLISFFSYSQFIEMVPIYSHYHFTGLVIPNINISQVFSLTKNKTILCSGTNTMASWGCGLSDIWQNPGR
jgi:hypothetical protein